MKRIFFGITYILLLSLMFAYMLISRGFQGLIGTCILDDASRTGISVIGFLFIFPAFVFAILAICIDKKMPKFCRDMFTLFAAAFSIGAAVICMFTGNFARELYIPIVLAAVSAVAFGLSLVGVINGFRGEKEENK